MKPIASTLALTFALALATLFAASVSAGTNAQRSGSAAVNCPSVAPKEVSSGSHSASGVLVPKGATTLLVCRYRGLNPPATAGRLARARLLTTAKRLAQLTAELDALPQSSGVVHCPMDDGSEITATFRYPQQAAVTIEVGLTGCRTVSRGNLTRTASSAAGSRLIDQLTALVPV